MNTPYSYGSEGYQIIYFVLLSFFDKTSYELRNLRPLSWDSVIRDVLLPEIVTRLIQEDLGLSRADAIHTFLDSDTFGKLMHPGDDSAALDDIQAKVTKMFKQAQADLTAWENSGSTLDFNVWVKAQREVNH